MGIMRLCTSPEKVAREMTLEDGSLLVGNRNVTLRNTAAFYPLPMLSPCLSKSYKPRNVCEHVSEKKQSASSDIHNRSKYDSNLEYLNP